EKISNMSVVRFLDMTGALITPEEKTEVLRSDPERVEEFVARDLDIINLQYKNTIALMKKFDLILDLPELFDRRISEFIDTLKAGDGADPEYLARWKIVLYEDLRRNISNITLLNREMRENSRF